MVHPRAEPSNRSTLVAKVQAILHQLPSHPRAEALAYQMRSHFQAYYGLMIRSVEDSAGRPGQRYLRWNPLRVIRWRKQVLAEENRRQVWDAGVNQQLEAHSRLIDGNTSLNRANGVSTWVKNVKEPMAIQANRSHHLTTPSSAPLRSAVALSRALSTDPQAALAARKSTVLKEWTVLPSEIIAFLDCKGNVDYFVPSSDLAQAALTDGLNTSSHNQSNTTPSLGANKRCIGESPNMMGMSPGSYDSSFGNKSTVSFVSDMQDTPSVSRLILMDHAHIATDTHLAFYRTNTTRKTVFVFENRSRAASGLFPIGTKATHHENRSTLEKDWYTSSKVRSLPSGNTSFIPKTKATRMKAREILIILAKVDCVESSGPPDMDQRRTGQQTVISTIFQVVPQIRLLPTTLRLSYIR
jgi:hypothetical protein